MISGIMRLQNLSFKYEIPILIEFGISPISIKMGDFVYDGHCYSLEEAMQNSCDFFIEQLVRKELLSKLQQS